MSSITRLHKILSVAAKYGLDDFLPASRSRAAIVLALLPYRLLGLFSSQRKGDRNTRLRLALEELGPIYIKLGLLVSTRRDFLDPELADELQALQDNVPPFPMPPIETVVAAALGAPADEFFASIDSQPLASASIAQVYGATLLDGSEVVIKVVRPGIEGRGSVGHSVAKTARPNSRRRLAKLAAASAPSR